MNPFEVWLRRARRSFQPGNALALGLSGTSLVGAYALVSGELPEQHAMALLALPAATALSLLRPAWIVLILLAVPPNFLAQVPNTILVMAVLVPLVALGLRDWFLDLTFKSGTYPILGLVLLASIHKTTESGGGLSFADGLLKLLAYYGVVMLLAYNASRRGDISVEQVGSALVLGAVLSGILEFALSPNPGQGSATQLTYGRSIANLAVMAFAVLLVRVFRPSPSRHSRARRLWYGGLATFMVVIAATTLLRASWLALSVIVALFLMYTGQAKWLLVAPLIVVVILAAPTVRERVLPTGESVDLTDYTTGRWRLWTLATGHIGDGNDPLIGQGWGYWWSLSPDEIFGSSIAFVTSEDQEYVFPHNDALFLTLDLGYLGFVLFVGFWLHLLVVFRRLLGASGHRFAALSLLGAPVMFVITQMVSNGLALRGVAERFFILAGVAFGLAARANSTTRTVTDEAVAQRESVSV